MLIGAKQKKTVWKRLRHRRAGDHGGLGIAVRDTE